MEPRKAMIGFAAAMLLAFVAPQAHAGAGAVCNEKMATGIDHTGTDGSECLASSDGTSTAKSKATGAKSVAEADVSTGGKANAVATGGSFSEAGSDTGSHSKSTASSGSLAEAFSDEHGKAKATATGGSDAVVDAFGKCKGTAKATGASLAVAVCEHDGTFAHATATGGGEAEGSDTSPPTCIPGPSGTAKVRSTGGNCG
jgi:hypothetical protein